MFGALHVLREEPTYATALTETDGVAFTLVRKSKALTMILFAGGKVSCVLAILRMLTCSLKSTSLEC